MLLHDNLVLLYFKLFCVDGNVGCTVLVVPIFHSNKLLFISVSLNLFTLVLSFIRQLTVLLMSSCAQQCRALTTRISLITQLRLFSTCTVWVKKSPPAVFWNFFPNGWEFLINFYAPIIWSFLHYTMGH